MNRTAIVVGGGIAGLTAAIALKYANFSVIVLERSSLLAPGAALTLWPNALRVLSRLGLAQDVTHKAEPIPSGAIYDATGRRIVPLRAEDIAKCANGSPVCISRTALQDILLANLSASEIRLNTACTSIDLREDGVTVRTASGESFTADLLLGADGIHSFVRAALHCRDELRFAGYLAWRCIVPVPQVMAMPGETWGDGGRRFGRVPLPGDNLYWFATEKTARPGWRPARVSEYLLERFGSWHAPIPRILEASREATILCNDIYDRAPLTRWGFGRATLAGDAAHPMTPDVGQGACQAIEDAEVLGMCLSGDSDVKRALKRYECLRIPRTSGIVKQSRLTGILAQLPAPLSHLRNVVLRAAGPAPQLRRMATIIGFDAVPH